MGVGAHCQSVPVALGIPSVTGQACSLLSPGVLLLYLSRLKAETAADATAIIKGVRVRSPLLEMRNGFQCSENFKGQAGAKEFGGNDVLRSFQSAVSVLLNLRSVRCALAVRGGPPGLVASSQTPATEL